MPFTAAEIAEKLQGQVIGDGSILLTGFAPASNAKPGDLAGPQPSLEAQQHYGEVSGWVSCVLDMLEHTAQVGRLKQLRRLPGHLIFLM